MSKKVVEWYFDLISPFAYLQVMHLNEIDAEFHMRPVVFGPILAAAGQLGPAEIPAKREHTYRLVYFQARSLGIPLRFPDEHPFNPLFLNRVAVLLGNDLGKVRKLFQWVWAKGKLAKTDQEVAALEKWLEESNLMQRAQDTKAKGVLRANTDAAIAAGVFGVPTAVVDDHLFWGFDSQPMLTAYLAGELDLDDPEYRRLQNLLVGVQRKR